MKVTLLNISRKYLRKNDWLTSNELSQYKQFGIVKRDTSRCINILNFYTIASNTRVKLKKYKNMEQLHENGFHISDSYRKAVKCYTVWNNHFNYRIDRTFFIDAMEDLYYDEFCTSKNLTQRAKEYERTLVRKIASTEYDRFWRIGETEYRNEFKSKYPECFVLSGQSKYTCFDNHAISIFEGLSSIDKTTACNRKRSLDRQNVIVKALNSLTHENIDKYIFKSDSPIRWRRYDITNDFLEKVNSTAAKKGFRLFTIASLRRLLPSIIRFCTNGLLQSVGEFVDVIKLTAYDFEASIEENAKRVKVYTPIARKISKKIFGVDIMSGEKPLFDHLNMLYINNEVSEEGMIMFYSEPRILKKIEMTTEEMMSIPTRKNMKGIRGKTVHLLSFKFARDNGLAGQFN